MNLQSITRSLKQAQSKAEKELSGITNALAALGKKPSGVAGPRVLSKSARKRISEAQVARWAKVKRAKLQLVKNGKKNGKKAA